MIIFQRMVIILRRWVKERSKNQSKFVRNIETLIIIIIEHFIFKCNNVKVGGGGKI